MRTDASSLEVTDGADEVLDLPLDAHVHTDLSPDSDLPIDALAALAAARGLAELAVTDHVDFERGAPAYDYTTFDAARARRARRPPSGGARTASPSGSASSSRTTEAGRRTSATISPATATTSRSGPSTIGSTRRTAGAGSPRGSAVGRWRRSWRRRSTRSSAAARSGLFDAIGHIDVVKRYLWPHVTPDQLADAPELYEPILEAPGRVGNGPGGQHEWAAPPGPGDLPVGGDRGAVPRDGWPAGDRRLGHAPDDPLRRRAAGWATRRRPRPASSPWRSGGAAGSSTCPSGSPQPEVAR